MFEFIKARKKTSVFVGLVILAIIYLLFFKKAAVVANTYTLDTVQKGTIVNSVSGSGQVVVSSQVDIKPQASGKIVALNVKAGDSIKAGTTIAEVDATDAERAVRDARLNLQSAQVALDKILKPADDLAITQAQNAVDQAQRSLDQATKDRDLQGTTNTQDQATAYDNAYNQISTTFLDLPGMMDDLKAVRSSSDVVGDDRIPFYELILGTDAPAVLKYKADYKTAYDAYNTVYASFKSISRSSSLPQIYTLASDTLKLSNSIAINLEDARNLLRSVTSTDDYKKLSIASTINTLKSTMETDVTTINGDISKLQGYRDALDNVDQNNPVNQQKKEDAVTSAQETLKEKQDALAKLQEPADALDVRSQQLTVEQRQNSLNDAESNYSDYFITSPFDAVVATLGISLGDTVSSGTSAATLITNDMQAQVSLNEVDAANVKVGDKATMTFDALPDLTITGKVYQLDTLGTVSQGVVTYNAKIVFDTPDERVKPGMSVSADIITSIKNDVLIVPNSAIKTQGNTSYVETLDPALLTATDLQNGTATLVTTPNRVTIEVGSSNDTDTEVTSGLNDGDQIIVQTISASKTTTPGAASSVRIPGLSGGTGARGG